MREKFLDLQTQNSSKQHGGVALAARVEKKAGKKYVKSKRENSDSSSSQKGFSREVLQVWGEGSLEEGLPRSCDAAPFADWKI